MLFKASLSPLPSASADADQLVDAAHLGERTGILHVSAGDLVKSAAHCCHRLIREQRGSMARETSHQIRHGVLT